MSFVDLMACDIWSEADIIRRTEAMIRSEFPLEAETILNRKVLGATTGAYILTQAEEGELARYRAVTLAAQAEGLAARADMALLREVLALEQAQRRLDRPELTADAPEGEPAPNAEAIAADAAARAAAQEVWDAATPEARSLFEQRQNR